MFGSIGLPELLIVGVFVVLVWRAFRPRFIDQRLEQEPNVSTPTMPAAFAEGLKRCPFCAEEIQQAAIVCKHCGRDLVTAQAPPRPAPTPTPAVIVQRAPPSNGVAAVLSLVIPGAGQMYKGNVGSGIAWLIFVVIGYMMFILPGIVLHFLCILTAASSNPAKSA